MKDKNIIFPSEMGYLLVYACGTSGYWDQDVNRRVVVEVPDGFDREWYRQRLQNGLESIEIV